MNRLKTLTWSLGTLLLTAAAWGESLEDLPLLDPPKPYAIEAARLDLEAWGAIDGSGAISRRNMRRPF